MQQDGDGEGEEHAWLERPLQRTDHEADEWGEVKVIEEECAVAVGGNTQERQQCQPLALRRQQIRDKESRQDRHTVHHRVRIRHDATVWPLKWASMRRLAVRGLLISSSA